MKTMKWIIGFTLIALTFSLQAQDRNAQEQETATGQEVNDDQDGQRGNGDTDGAIDPRGTADTPGAEEAAAAANANDADTTTEVSNAPAVPQTTSSSSGSPAVLAGENGKERDGTNTVQRASMNMVGSPVGNLNLSEGQAVDADSELADRQDQTQEKQVSAETRGQGDNAVSESNEINNNTRKENNALSDQNLSSKDKNNQPPADEENKKDKRKRKKDRG